MVELIMSNDIQTWIIRVDPLDQITDLLIFLGNMAHVINNVDIPRRPLIYKLFRRLFQGCMIVHFPAFEAARSRRQRTSS